MGSKSTLGRLAGGVEWVHLGPLPGCCECGDEPSGSGAPELINYAENKIQPLRKSADIKYSIKMLFTGNYSIFLRTERLLKVKE
jgi:hypothetical protein